VITRNSKEAHARSSSRIQGLGAFYYGKCVISRK
jgi:hypothetical protein